MWNKNNTGIIYSDYNSKKFNLNEYKEKVLSFLDRINEDETWIRSGHFIKEQFKDKISSYQLLGKIVLPEGAVKIDVLLVKTQVGITLSEAEKDIPNFINSYLSEFSITSAFVVAVPSFGDGFIEYFFGAQDFFKVKIPNDMLSFVCNEVLKNYINSQLSICDTKFQLKDFYTKESTLSNKALDVENILKEIKFCDMSAGSGDIILAFSSLIAEMRLAISSFLNSDRTKNKSDYISEFLSNSLYATSLDLGSLTTLKIGLQLNFPKCRLNESNIVWGNILIEDLFLSTKFNLVITNPPHLRQELFSMIKNKLNSYSSSQTSSDLYCYYAEKAFELAEPNGSIGLIMSNKWMISKYGTPLRTFLLDKNIVSLVDYDQIAPITGIATALSIVIANNSPSYKYLSFTNVYDDACNDISKYVKNHSQLIDKTFLCNESWNFQSVKVSNLIEKLNNSQTTPLSQYVDNKLYRGILTGLNKAFFIDRQVAEKLIENEPSLKKVIKPILQGRDIKQYTNLSPSKYVIFMPKGFTNKERDGKDPIDWFIESYRTIALHLAKFEDKAKKRSDQGDYWWELRSCKYYDVFNENKIICPMIIKRLSATIDENKYLGNDKTIIIASDELYLLGLLNSKVLDFYFRNSAPKLLNSHFELKLSLLRKFPIRKISQSNSFLQNLKKEIELNAKILRDIYTANTKNKIKINNDARDIARKLDSAVYKLYRLNAEEIKIIENY